MAQNISEQQLEIKEGTHGKDYGSWMSNPVFYVFGGLALLAAVLAILSFTTFHLTVLGVLLAVVTVALAAMLIWMAWIRRRYALGKGGMMERVHQFILEKRKREPLRAGIRAAAEGTIRYLTNVRKAEPTAPPFSYQFSLCESLKTKIDTRVAAVYNGSINKRHAPLLARSDKKV